ncbi:solute carrier family 35 member G1 [Hypomesus transpacificus]|uniref:solute carrier family 35 member G1 n=1 Tax=Hypomesus transpacificus TaxID=137520 RepID=UPI001F0828A8|nr:solute carrier family 35 member G1 [Hypomesus transpacificus]
MTESSASIDDRVLSVVPRRQEDIRVVFHKVADIEDEEDDVHATERVYLQSSHDSPCFSNDDEKAGSTTKQVDNTNAILRFCSRYTCWRTDCSDGNPIPAGGETPFDKEPEKKRKCPGLGLFYGLLSTVFFSVIALLVKSIEGIHAIEISAIRCFFQMLFVMPLLLYHNVGFLGPRDKRVYLVLRGLLGSNAMILLYYAVQQMPLADATVIMFSNPVFTSLLAWIFLKEKCTIWDCVFTVFTLAGVILIARPPFLFGARTEGIEGDYTNHLKGTIAAFGGAIAAAFVFVVLRKMGKSVHYYLSVWYYAVMGFIECIIALSVMEEWTLPFCGRDRWILMLIAVLGIAGQIFLTKALQIEKAGPVALMRTVDVVLAFSFQFLFFDRKPTWWSLGGALCVVVSTSGVALRKLYANKMKS